ncbi:MAG: hypothetical protein UY87_C0001G0012 [Candidatus Peribacteria bacterium GW2011_GWC2_54_8]|nr:MAG: hypothetical protein UY87_C0001G0012 [Candidatus Peribacteria bacterium GW2011_GWC2_54_8]
MQVVLWVPIAIYLLNCTPDFSPMYMFTLFHLRTGSVVFLVVAGFFLFTASAHAADRYWGGTGDRWEDTTNWSALPKGATGASVPGASDTAIFSTSGTTVQIRSAVSVGGLRFSTAWAGSLLLGTGSLYAGSTGISIGGGTFVAGTAAVSTSGNFTQTGGTVRGLQGTFTLSGSISITGASTVFSSTGTVVFDGGTQTSTIGSTASGAFKNVTIASTTSTTIGSNQAVRGILQVNTGSTFAIGIYTLSATGASIVNYGTINEGTGKISHTATNMIISDGTYVSQQAGFPVGATVYFSLTEQDENINGTAQDTVSITVELGNGDSEAVTLQETNDTSAIFVGSIATSQISPTASNGTLEADTSEIITATFTDAQDALTNSDTADLTVGSSPATGTGSHGAGGKAARLALMRARQAAALKSSAPESDEPVVKVDYGVTKVQPRSVQRKTSTPSEREVRLQNRLQQYGVPQSTSSLKPAAVREQVTENFKVRTCGRVMRWFQGNGKMLGRVNTRLEGRFGFTCRE